MLSNCVKCKDLVLSRKQVVQGYGDIYAKTMFVGLAPGRNGADITGVPFTRDPSGLLFQEIMIKSGCSLERDSKVENPKLKSVYVTNLIKCNPQDSKGCNRNPTKDEINNCFPILCEEIHSINPIAVIIFGKTATECLIQCKAKRFGDLHNSRIYKDNQLYIPFFHPSYIIRGAYPRDKYITELINTIRSIKPTKTW